MTWNYFVNDEVVGHVNLTILVQGQGEFFQLLRRIFGGLDVFREPLFEVLLGDSPVFEAGFSTMFQLIDARFKCATTFLGSGRPLTLRMNWYAAMWASRASLSGSNGWPDAIAPRESMMQR